MSGVHASSLLVFSMAMLYEVVISKEQYGFTVAQI